MVLAKMFDMNLAVVNRVKDADAIFLERIAILSRRIHSNRDQMNRFANKSGSKRSIHLKSIFSIHFSYLFFQYKTNRRQQKEYQNNRYFIIIILKFCLQNVSVLQEDIYFKNLLVT